MFDNVDGVSRNRCAWVALFKGDNLKIGSLFRWGSTHQGNEYWRLRKIGRAPLYLEDKQYLLGVMRKHRIPTTNCLPKKEE